MSHGSRSLDGLLFSRQVSTTILSSAPQSTVAGGPGEVTILLVAGDSPSMPLCQAVGEEVMAGFLFVSVAGMGGHSACILLGTGQQVHGGAVSRAGLPAARESLQRFIFFPFSSDCWKLQGCGSAPAVRQDVHVPWEGGHTKLHSL